MRKKDGSWWFYVDNCCLNAVPNVVSYLLPNINDTLDRIASSTWFSSLYLYMEVIGRCHLLQRPERRWHLLSEWGWNMVVAILGDVVRGMQCTGHLQMADGARDGRPASSASCIWMTC